MRLPISSVIASLIVSLTAPSPPSFAEKNNERSTIRLTSTSEPARSSSASDSNLPATQTEVEQPQAAPPIQQSEQSAVQSAPSPAPSKQPEMEQRQAAPPIQWSEQLAEQASRSAAPAIVHTPVDTAANIRTRMPAGLYASPAARSALNQQPVRPSVQSAPRPQINRRGGKPFQAVQNPTAVSPYLYLNAGANTSNSITNYFAFVNPQLEQEESARKQQREIQQLKTQLQRMSTGAGSQSVNPNPAAHYMDTAQFYRGFQRQ